MRRRRELVFHANVEYIFSSEPENVTNYQNVMNHSFSYSSVPHCKADDIKLDLYLAANGSKDRLKKVYDIYNCLRQCDVISRFHLQDVKKDDQKYKPEIIFLKRNFSYYKIVEEVIVSNCLLEVLHSDNTGETIRYNETVCYNKKLLTNNKNVVNLPFYNPEYMHVFEKPEDIDWDWVKERVPVDYHYDGRFSPTHLIDRIIELEEEKEKTKQ